jgi:hypothetical protein
MAFRRKSTHGRDAQLAIQRRRERFYAMSVTYDAVKWGDDMDERIYKAAGRFSSASGFGFGVRDHSWYYSTLKEARAAAKKFKASDVAQHVMTVKAYSF